MPKKCIYPNCDHNQFGGKYCLYHQYMRNKEGGDKHKAKSSVKKAYKMPNKSITRKEEEKEYFKVCDELTAEIREQNGGKVYCFFSGEEITADKPHYHHLKGRRGSLYTDKAWLVPALDRYHSEGYHNKSIRWLLEQTWYINIFLVNLRNKSEELYQKELKKQDKAKNIRNIFG